MSAAVAIDRTRQRTTGRAAAGLSIVRDRPLRVAFLVHHFPRLSELFIVDQANGLLERGHDVRIFALEGPAPDDTVHPVMARYGLLERTRVARAPSTNYLRRAGRAAAALSAADGRGRRAMLRTTNPLAFGLQGASLRLLLKAEAMIGAGPFDVVHGQFGTLGDAGLALRQAGALSPDSRLVTSFRGYDISRHVRDHGAGCYRDLFARGDLFLANCDHFRRRAVALGCPPERIATLRSGIDTARFSFRSRHRPEDGRVHLLSVGRLVEKKGLADALRAVAQVARRWPNVRYTVIGDGPLRAALEALAADLGVADLTTFRGAAPQQVVQAHLERAHLFLAPSVRAADGDEDAPINTLKEAMASGLPVVSTRHGGIPELVEDGVAGFLVPERDPAALADRLGHLLDHPEAWLAMGRAGRRRVVAEYDMDRLADDLIRLYRRAIATPSPRPDVAPEIAPSHRAREGTV